jgi:hypothetical protein
MAPFGDGVLRCAACRILRPVHRGTGTMRVLILGGYGVAPQLRTLRPGWCRAPIEIFT